jgi:hypothetical protein
MANPVRMFDELERRAALEAFKDMTWLVWRAIVFYWHLFLFWLFEKLQRWWRMAHEILHGRRRHHIEL